MQHYYFKFWEENKGLKIWEEKNPEMNKEEIHLPIYFGNWKANEYTTKISSKFSNNIQSAQMRQNQIDIFFNLQKLSEPVYFWIYSEDEILCFKSIDLKIFDGPEEYINAQKSLPKSIKARKINSFKKIEHPEFFSNINSNQKYNRKTIVKLDGAENEYAEALISGNKVTINTENFCNYLSPTEFETLIFLIFTNETSMCSSFRGGTLKDYDLRVFLEKDFHEIHKGEHWLQVKKKLYNKRTHNGITIHLGENSFEKNIFGKKWVIDRVKAREDIQKWLSKCSFNYDLLNVNI